MRDGAAISSNLKELVADLKAALSARWAMEGGSLKN